MALLVLSATQFEPVGLVRVGASGPAPLLSFVGARTIALRLDNSTGGGPWFVFQAVSLSIRAAESIPTYDLYPNAMCGYPDLSSPTATAPITISSGPTDLRSGLSPFWLFSTGNSAGELREILVSNGTVSALGDVPPSSGCDYLRTNLSFPHPVLDTPLVMASAWADGGSNFTAHEPNPTVEFFLGSDYTPSNPFYWVIRWSSCTPALGLQYASLPGVELLQQFNATLGTLIDSWSISTRCVSP